VTTRATGGACAARRKIERRRGELQIDSASFGHG
jgi:hypothetical protein